jgi:hypothetical protein
MLFCSEEITDQVWPSGLTVQPAIYLVEQKFMAIHFNTDVTDKLGCSYSRHIVASLEDVGLRSKLHELHRPLQVQYNQPAAAPADQLQH